MGGDVEAAFELLNEVLAEERSRILEQGGEAFRENRLAEVDLLRSQAAVLEGLLEKIAGTQREWLDSIADQQNHVGIADETSLIGGAVPGQSTGLLGPGAQQASAGGSIREVSLTMSYNGVLARARHFPGTGHTMLLVGSTVRRQVHDSLIPKYRNDRRRCEKDGSLSADEDSGPTLTVRKNMPFDSQSGAAQFVAGCAVSGNREWRVEDTGKTLGQYLKARRKSPALDRL
jgi:Domain of unknown function (DUF4357)